MAHLAFANRRYEKIALRFESAFWRADGMTHLMVFPSDETEPAMWVFDLDAFGAVRCCARACFTALRRTRWTGRRRAP